MKTSKLMIQRIASLAVLALLASTATAQTVTLTATPATAKGITQVDLAWSSTGVTSCVASDAWTGSKATSGSETLYNINSTRKYTLTCSSSTGTAVLSWSAPTTNTDNSPLTDLTSYDIFSATSVSTLQIATPVSVAGNKTTYTFSNLAPNTYFFAIKAVNSKGDKSDMSNSVSKVITAASVSASATITVTPVPTPPTMLTIAQNVYDTNWNGRLGLSLNRQVGTIDLGKPCDEKIKVARYPYYQVKWSDVTLYPGIFPKNVLVAPCGKTA